MMRKLVASLLMVLMSFQVVAQNGVAKLDSSGETSLTSLLAPGQTLAQLETGQIDAAPIFQSACQANPGSTIDVKPGIYWWNSAQTFTSSCKFKGQGWNERNGAGANPSTSPERGTWIKITNPAIVPITFSGYGAAGSGGFYHMGIEQAQPAPSAGWSPRVYPPVFTVAGTGGQVVFDDLNFWGIYDAISVPGTAGAVGRVTMDRLRGQPFHSTFSGTLMEDTTRASDWHLWPVWSQDANVLAWQTANGSVITCARCDGWQQDRLFALGYKTGVQLTADTNGVSTLFNIADFYCDSCKTGVLVTGNGTTGHIGVLSYGAEAGSGVLTGSHAYQDAASGTNVTIDDLKSLISGGSAVALTSPSGGATLNIGSISIANYNQDKDGSPGIQIAPGAGKSRIDLAHPPAVGGSNNGGAIANANGNILTNVWQSWTPALIGSATPGSPTYVAAPAGDYVINGNTAMYRGSINVSSIKGASGSVLIGGVPFVSGGSAISAMGTVDMGAGITLDHGYTSLTLAIPFGLSNIQLLESGSGQSTVPLSILKLATGAALSFQVTQRLY